MAHFYENGNKLSCYDLLSYDSMYSDMLLLMFWKNMLPQSSW